MGCKTIGSIGKWQLKIIVKNSEYFNISKIWKNFVFQFLKGRVSKNNKLEIFKPIFSDLLTPLLGNPGSIHQQ